MVVEHILSIWKCLKIVNDVDIVLDCRVLRKVTREDWLIMLSSNTLTSTNVLYEPIPAFGHTSISSFISYIYIYQVTAIYKQHLTYMYTYVDVPGI